VCVAAGWGKLGGEGKELERATHKRPRSYLSVPRDLERGGDGVVVMCSPWFQPRKANKDAVEEIVRAKLGFGDDVSCIWVQRGRHNYAQFRPKDPIREVARFAAAEHRQAVERESSSSTIVLGLTRGDRAVKVNLDRESPHMLMSAGTGGGKSTMLTLVAAQLMWHGAEPWVADYKRHSLRWLRDLPGVRYARDISEIHRLVIELAAEGDRRNRAWDHVGLDDEGPQFRRIVLILEELSTTMDLLRDYWTDTRESNDPATSPAIRALSALLNMGRAVRINVLAVAQRADAKTMGSGAMRENFSVRILAEYTPQTWKMLAAECEFIPKSKVKGRAQVCVGSSATETQVIYMTDREAQAWVADRRGMQPRVAVRADRNDQGESTGHVADATTSKLPNGLEPVTLWEASSDKGRRIVAATYDSLRQERRRHPNEFPEPIGERENGANDYDPRDLQRWEMNRERPPESMENTENGTNEVDREDHHEHREDMAEANLAERYPQSDRDNRDRDRFTAMVAKGEGCWLWTGAVDGDGYGQFRVDSRTVRAHRWAYEQASGPIPEGLTLDHTCQQPACVRPDHLESVTASENQRRRWERQRAQQGVQP
jgi:HNH endonuclease